MIVKACMNLITQQDNPNTFVNDSDPKELRIIFLNVIDISICRINNPNNLPGPGSCPDLRVYSFVNCKHELRYAESSRYLCREDSDSSSRIVDR